MPFPILNLMVQMVLIVVILTLKISGNSFFMLIYFVLSFWQIVAIPQLNLSKTYKITFTIIKILSFLLFLALALIILTLTRNVTAEILVYTTFGASWRFLQDPKYNFSDFGPIFTSIHCIPLLDMFWIFIGHIISWKALFTNKK